VSTVYFTKFTPQTLKKLSDAYIIALIHFMSSTTSKITLVKFKDLFVDDFWDFGSFSSTTQLLK